MPLEKGDGDVNMMFGPGLASENDRATFPFLRPWLANLTNEFLEF